jgi:hypothetical protein
MTPCYLCGEKVVGITLASDAHTLLCSRCVFVLFGRTA